MLFILILYSTSFVSKQKLEYLSHKLLVCMWENPTFFFPEQLFYAHLVEKEGKSLNFVGYFLAGILCGIISLIICIFQEVNIPIFTDEENETQRGENIVHNHIANK